MGGYALSFPGVVTRVFCSGARNTQTGLTVEALASGDIKTEVLLRQDTPHRGIIKAARQDRSDPIALRTRGLKGLKNYILGSTAEKVVRHALCPALTFNRYRLALSSLRKVEHTRSNFHARYRDFLGINLHDFLAGIFRVIGFAP